MFQQSGPDRVAILVLTTAKRNLVDDVMNERHWYYDSHLMTFVVEQLKVIKRLNCYLRIDR